MTFAFDLVRATTIDLDVFDTTGRRVATVDSGPRQAGHHELRWNRRDASGNSLAAGVYYGRLRASDGSRITRLVLLPK
jgi:flagellar hook assembly protein FlgD